MNALLSVVNAWRLKHGKLAGVIAACAMIVYKVAVGDYADALGLAGAAFGLHHAAKGDATEGGAPTILHLERPPDSPA